MSGETPPTLRMGDRTVTRLGYGAAKLTGPGIWGPPADPAAAVALLRRAVSLGVSFVDTADSYGPYASEEIVRRALHPYTDVVVATKGGCVRTGPDAWATVCRPAYLRQCCELSLRRLDIETIDLYQLHEVDPLVPFEEQLGVIVELQREGKVRHIGLSSVTEAQLEAATAVTAVTSVQAEYNVLERRSHAMLRRCESGGIAFVPFFPLGDGRLAAPDGPLGPLAAIAGCSPAQLALAWLLHRSPAIVPIPGTADMAEMEENVGALMLLPPGPVLAALDALGGAAR